MTEMVGVFTFSEFDQWATEFTTHLVFPEWLKDSECYTSLDNWLGRVSDQPCEYEAEDVGGMFGPCYLQTYAGFHAIDCYFVDEVSQPNESFSAYSFWLGAPVGMEA